VSPMGRAQAFTQRSSSHSAAATPVASAESPITSAKRSSVVAARV
jgi:hypothetical protein